MLEIKNISKVYVTESLKQKALDNISINFRKCEFVSILGPSGSGKTTFLNIIGGLDHYDSGDLTINEVSTKKYSDRDWDSYRNHRIGFVFQTYNLITHQSILNNVELALTLSGVAKKKRVKLAKEALEKVGLKEHINKRPSQLSGGQMQRVAIARALVNNPDILLADEPTGALDTETSKQIMNLLKEVSKEKLVIMVTHNPDIAKDYSTRIVRLKDGKITDDSDSYDGNIDTKEDLVIEKKKSKKTSMSFLTALSLSLNNLMTKKGRTFLTAFAGSIGIIGIALILSLSSGVQSYIDKTEKETLSSYPLAIEKTTVDYTSMMTKSKEVKEVKCKNKKICTTDDITINPIIQMASAKKDNDLKKFKSELDNNYKNIKKYTTDIQYTYDLDLQLYSPNTDKGIVRVNPNSLNLQTTISTKQQSNSLAESSGTSHAESSMSMMSTMQNQDVFKELINNNDLLNEQYKLLSGDLPKKSNELVIITNEKHQIPASLMYSLDLEDRVNLSDIITKVKDGKNVSLGTKNYSYDSLVGKTFKLLLNTDYYTKENGLWKNNTYDTDYMKNLINNGEEVKIVGVAAIKEDTVEATSGYVGYTHDLATHVINKINETSLAKDQKENPDKNVLTGLPFDDLTSSLEINYSLFGINDLEIPQIINIYPKDYDSKEKIESIIDKYNDSHKKSEKITYTDYVGVLMSGITTIVDVITYVLVAFVAISLVVSSIMIAIITYISVLERTKEIGILRAIGASKKDITRVFNSETVIEGLFAGVFGVVVTIFLCFPINAIVKNLTGVANIAGLPVNAGIILILISVLLTVIAGLVPSRIASKKDPVESLRSE